MARTRFPRLAACLLLACSACSNGKTETVTRIPLGNAPGAGGTSTGSGASPSTGGETTGAGGTGANATGGTTSTGAGGAAGSGGTTSAGGTGDGTGGMSAGGTGGGTGGMNTGGTGGTGVTGHFQMLVFSKTAGFRHTSAIEAGQVWVESVASANDFEITTTEDAAIFTDASLDPFQVIFFLNTTDDILDSAQQTAMENFIKKGRGFVGTHSATDTEDGFGWAWYQELVGSDYNGHGPANTPGTLTVDSGALNHPATKDLPQSWNRNEEWYLFKRDVSALSGVTVLLRFSEDDRPMAWTREWDGGRSFYTACGHDGAAFQEELFQKHLLGGILWAAGRVD